MVDTIKFSEFASGGDLEPNQTTVGLDNTSTINTRFNNPFPLLPPGTTGDRPVPAANMYYRLRFNTTIVAYEYYDPISATWIEMEDSASILPLLASHLVGEGASLIGLQDQSNVTTKTVQDFANASFIAQVSNGTLQNAQYTGLLATGFVSVTTTTGVLNSRTIGGTANQIDVTNSDGAGNSVHSLSATLDLPGTFTIQASTIIDEIIDDDTFATATATNIPTAESVKAYVDSVAGGLVDSVSGVLNRIDVDNTDPANPIVDISSTYVGQNTITTLGTIGTGVWEGTPVTVPFGGTGLTSATAFAVLCGGTTSTSPFQSVTSVGTSGQVLTSNGAGALPTFQSVSGSGTVNSGLINQVAWYAASGTAVSGLATLASGVLVTSAGSVPSISTTLPSGLTIPLPKINQINDSNALAMLGFTTVASAVNNFQMQNNVTTGSPVLSAVGSDTNIGIQIDSKGTSGVFIKGQQTGLTAAGYRGEVMTAQVVAASAVAMTNSTARNITSLSLTAGSWLVLGVVSLAGSTTNISQCISWCSLTSATLPDNSIRSGQSSAVTTQFNLPTAALIVNVTTTTTVFLEGYAVFVTGTVGGSGQITAIRL